MKKIKDFDLEIVKTANIFFIIGFIIVLIICLIFNWALTYLISFLIGYLANILGFLKNNYIIDSLLNGERQNSKKTMIGNTITSYLLYGITLVINLLVPIFNIFVCFFGLLIIKITIVVKYGFKR